MKFEQEIKSIEGTLQHLSSNVKTLKAELEYARVFTNKLLTKLAKAGYKKVSISTKTDLIPSSKTWPFGHEGNLFAMGPIEDEVKDKEGWPAVWTVVKELGIGEGAGNSGQYQIDDSRLIDGIYEFKSGKWLRLE